MVNYCCVQGCGRNSKQNKQLNYYSLPKERRRQVQWLQAAGRSDLLEKDKVLVSHRFCSRHFPPSSIKNKHLCDTAVPTLCLPGSSGEGNINLASLTHEELKCRHICEDHFQAGDVLKHERRSRLVPTAVPRLYTPVTAQNDEAHQHKGIVCNSCGAAVAGFRYKCVSCEDYDLCPQCEARETHPDHYMLRMPRPLKYKLADDLTAKWRVFFSAEHATPDSDSDDEPITKYRSRGLELAEEVRSMIREEVARVSELPDTMPPQITGKRKTGDQQRAVKRIRMDGTIGYDDEDRGAPEVVFADVNEDTPLLEVKDESVEEWKKMVQVKLSDDLTELMIEIPSNAAHAALGAGNNQRP